MHGENSKQCLCHHRFSKAGLCGFRGERQLRIPLQMGRFHRSPPKSCCRTSRELPKWALGSGTETAPAASLAEPTPGFYTTHNTPTSSSRAVLESGFSKPNFCTSNYDLSKQVALYVCSKKEELLKPVFLETNVSYCPRPIWSLENVRQLKGHAKQIAW